MTPAEEKARLASVQLALEHLLTGGPKTRKELFGEAGTPTIHEFQRRTLRSLEDQGVVLKAETGTPPVMRVHLKNRKKAEYLLANPVELAQIVWPSSRPAKPEQPTFELIQTEDPQLDAAMEKAKAPEPEIVLLDIPRPTSPPTPPTPVFLPPPQQTMQELMERLLIIMDAACQRIIYTSEQVDSLKKEIDQMKKQVNHLWEQLK